MKRQIATNITVLAVIVTVFFSVLTGSRFLKMTAGPVTAENTADFENLEKQYITYSVTHPIASYPEEYYSGDQSRIRKMAYITYDEERQVLLKIIIPERKNSGFEKLMRAANRSEELKKEWGEMQKSDERPIDVSGSLLPLTDTEEIGLIQRDLQQSIPAGNQRIADLALEQSKWYVLEEGYINKVPKANLWICAVLILLNIAVFLFSLFSLLRKSRSSSFSGDSNVEKMLNRQRIWLEPWCEKGVKRRNLTGMIVILGTPAMVTALGFYLGGSTLGVLTMHLPLGLIIGELCGIPLLSGAGLSFNADKILKEYQKNLRKKFSGKADLEALSEDLLKSEAQWSVSEKGKEEIRYGILGERYWIVFGEGGFLEAVDSEQVARIKSETVSGQIRSGRVRIHYVHYIINIKYKNSDENRDWDTAFSFNSEDAAGQFMIFARKRLGDRASEVIY